MISYISRAIQVDTYEFDIFTVVFLLLSARSTNEWKMKLIISSDQYIICFKVFNSFNGYVDYIRHEKVTFL